MNTNKYYLEIITLLGIISIIFPFHPFFIITLTLYLGFSFFLSNTKKKLFIIAILTIIIFSSISTLKTKHILKKTNIIKALPTNTEFVIQFLEPANQNNSFKTVKLKNIPIKVYVNNVFKKQPKYGDEYKVKIKKVLQNEVRNPHQIKSFHQILTSSSYGSVILSEATYIKNENKSSIKEIAFQLRLAISQFFNKQPFSAESALLTSLIIGNKTIELPKYLLSAYKKLGLTHMLVVSGSQVALLSTLLFMVLSKFSQRKTLNFCIIVLFQTLFYFITGGGISLLRAIIFNCICLFKKTYHLNLSTSKTISLTTLLLLIIDPFMVLDISAQLSFAATFSLLFGVESIKNCCPKHWPDSRKTFTGIIFAPFIYTAPLLWFHFNAFSPISLISNALFIVIVELMVIIGFTTTILGLFGIPFASVIILGLTVILKLVNQIVLKLCNIPYATIFTEKPHIIIAILSYIFIFTGTYIYSNQIKKNQKLFNHISICFFVCILIYYLSPNKYHTITFIDVGQGDSILISSKTKKHLLVDTGGIIRSRTRTKTIAEITILPFLIYQGINKLHYVLISHFDQDHSGGVRYLQENFKIDAIISNGNPKYPRTLRFPNEKKLFVGSEIEITQLAPNFYNSGESKNDNSLVNLVKIKNITLLLTGDIEYKQEQLLVRKKEIPSNVTLLKVSHHGSKTSSSSQFLNQVKPIISIISCGKDNRYGHPNKHVIERLQLTSNTVLRTDLNGAIQFKTDGKKLFYKTII